MNLNVLRKAHSYSLYLIVLDPITTQVFLFHCRFTFFTDLYFATVRWSQGLDENGCDVWILIILLWYVMENKLENGKIARICKNLQTWTMCYLLAFQVYTKCSFLFTKLQNKMFERRKSWIIGKEKVNSNYTSKIIIKVSYDLIIIG